MRAFVTGGTGFVGANLIRLLLAEGIAVRSLARSHSSLTNLQKLDVEIVNGDLTDPNVWQAIQGCEVMFHVAAHYSLWQADRAELYRCNVEGTRNILAAAQRAGVERTVYTSSVAAIGVSPSGIADEAYQSPPEKLIGAYKQSKYWAEQEAVRAVAAGQDVVIVNPSSPIGPWDVKPTPTGDIILRFLQRRMPAYLNTGLNFIDVRDVAQGHLLALQHGKPGERYILGHQNLTLKEFFGLLAELTGIPAPEHIVPAWLPLSVAWIDETILTRLGKSPDVPIDGVRMATQTMFYDPTKAIQTLGLPQTPIRQATQAAIDWFRAHGYVNELVKKKGSRP